MIRIPPVLWTLALVILAGCGALGRVSDAAAPQDAYTLSPLPVSGKAAGGNRHIVVELPSSAAELATDRILIKPTALQAQYLPDGSWTDPAPALVQTLLLTSLQNVGGFRLVSRVGAGLTPDYTLMTELQEFQAETSVVDPAAGVTIRVAALMTMIRESDRQIVSTRRFSAATTVASDDTLLLIGGFDSAMQSVLADAIPWIRAQGG